MNRLRLMSMVIIILSLGGPLPGRARDRSVEDRIEGPVREAIEIRQETQRERERWRDKKGERIALYEDLQREEAELKERQKRMMEEKAGLEGRIETKKGQLRRIRQISDQIRPYLGEVMDRLRQFFEGDVPFLKEERLRRIDNLEKVMAEPDVAVSEKLRKVMEALMVEAEYGQTIEVSRETVDIGGQPVLADIFRFGRVALFYQGLDGRSCGFYNVAEGSWSPLPHKYDEAVRTAVEIGAKRLPIEMLSLPVGRLKVR